MDPYEVCTGCHRQHLWVRDRVEGSLSGSVHAGVVCLVVMGYMNLISSSFCLSDVNSALAYSDVPIEFKHLKGVSGAKLFSKMIASPEELPPSTLETRQDQGRARQSHALYRSMINDDDKNRVMELNRINRPDF